MSDDKVYRDMFYDGNIKLENCAVVTRVAPSFLRFGSFEVVLPPSPQNYYQGGPCKSHGEGIYLKIIKRIYESDNKLPKKLPLQRKRVNFRNLQTNRL